ncbi:MAG TPA: polysaccharide biosynthesis/export family protein [Planctomycetaceae bacterium]|nr:polysaccharide biosynthesis/export family protein [Planctomycetaceae bacterium]
MNRRHLSHWHALVAVIATLGASGCANMRYGCDLPAVPAHRVPLEVMARPRADMQQISITRLRQNPPDVYQLGPDDVLGIHIPFVLGKEDEPPVVHFPEQGDQPPALGYPIPIREDGTLAVPLINPVKVEGLTLAQAQDKIREEYVAADILKEGKEKIVVTLMRRRMYRVSVIREESGNVVGGGQASIAIGSTKRGTGVTVDLPAYENDVLHALNLTGGMPGLDAKNEIYILRGSSEDAARRDELLAALKAAKNPCDCPCPEPPDAHVIRIPLRFYPEDVPQFVEKDIILQTGDIIYVPTREREIFYTGGALGGGQHPLPRDYDLDILGAVALAGGPMGGTGTGIRGFGAMGGGGGFGGNRAGGLFPPSHMIVLRKLPCGGQIPIAVNLNRALVDPGHRILIQPEDTLILRYTFQEEILTLASSLFQVNYLIGSGLNR